MNTDMCPKCANLMEWENCWNCGGEGYIALCNEDPLWYDEDDMKRCDECRGDDGWWHCVMDHNEMIEVY